MKMKKILVSMFLLFLVLCLKSNVSNAAETDALNRWDLTKEYTVEQNSIMRICQRTKKRAGFLRRIYWTKRKC